MQIVCHVWAWPWHELKVWIIQEQHYPHVRCPTASRLAMWCRYGAAEQARWLLAVHGAAARWVHYLAGMATKSMGPISITFSLPLLPSCIQHEDTAVIHYASSWSIERRSARMQAVPLSCMLAFLCATSHAAVSTASVQQQCSGEAPCACASCGLMKWRCVV